MRPRWFIALFIILVILLGLFLYIDAHVVFVEEQRTSVILEKHEYIIKTVVYEFVMENGDYKSVSYEEYKHHSVGELYSYTTILVYWR